MNVLAAIGYPLLAVAALNLGIGLFLLARRHGHPLTRYAGALGCVNALYSWVVASAYIHAARGLPYDFYYRAAWVGWLGMAPMAQIILTLQGKPAAAGLWGRRLYALWGAVLMLCLSTDLFEAGALSLLPFVDRVGWLERPARAAGAVTLLWALVELFRVQRASSGRRRQQIAYFLLGLALYAAAGLVLAGLVQIVGSVRFDPALVSYFSLAWMTFTFYAITRHRLFDVRFVVSRVTVALLLTTLLVALQVFLFRALAPWAGTTTALVVVSILSGVALFATPVTALLERAIEWLLVRRRYDYRRAMTESVRALTSLGTVDDVLAQLLGAIRDTIASTSATLLLREGEIFRRRQSYGAHQQAAELSSDSTLVRWLSEHSEPFVREEQELGHDTMTFQAVARDLQSVDGEVAVAMRYRAEVLGILIVGGKADREAFFQADIDLLETLANEAAIAVTNARLVEDLQQAVRARDDFVSIAGHELRTPLMALRLSVYTALRMVPDDGAVGDRLRTAERQIERLTRLTDELLDVSRIGAGRMTLDREPTDLGKLACEVAARFADELARGGRRFELAVTEAVSGRWDRARIEQVVGNLLANAVKYGGTEPITVVVEREDDTARLIVRDRGIGIEPADQQRIFDRFERAVPAQHAGGFGLGLWISKQIVDAHRGQIHVTSAPGAGSTFIVELPLD